MVRPRNVGSRSDVSRRTTGAARSCCLLVALATTLAGCGLGAGGPAGGGAVRITVTGDYGTRVLQRRAAKTPPKSETVMRLLQRGGGVSTRYGGGFVQCIDGVCGANEQGRRLDWFFYVNGVEAGKGASATRVHGGERIWWDRRDWSSAERVPAVVGSFPEPFLHGIGAAERLPVRVECTDTGSPACAAVERRLVGYGIPASKGTLRSSFALRTLRVLVGRWIAVREDPALLALEDGPAASGVFAEPRPDGRSIALLDARGAVRRTLGAGGGLVAATRTGEDTPVWTVTGTDEAGVERAARAFSEPALRDRYAVAAAGGPPLALPLVGASP